MSSHREAPAISKDPVADSTDTYAFVSYDRPDMVTLIANYVPLQAPAGGPNFYEFGDDVLYQIHIDNNGDGLAEIIYEFQFYTQLTTPTSFLYNTGPIQHITDSTWNRKQFYDLTRWNVPVANSFVNLGKGLTCPPCNIGPLSTPNFETLTNEAIHQLPGGGQVYAGQRGEGFYVDLGAVFDLGDLRPFQQDHNHFGLNVPELQKPAPGINATKGVNVHSLVLQVPKTALTAGGANPTDPTNPRSTIGVWTTASRQMNRIYNYKSSGTPQGVGPFTQVSRLANPLVNELQISLDTKNFWNSQSPVNDAQFAHFTAHPELAKLLPTLYPGVFPNLDAYNKSGKSRADLLAIFLTGIPNGVVPGFPGNFTSSHQAEQVRLNLAIAPTPLSKANNLGLIGGDVAGFPNGRRVFDDTVTVELRAVAGATIPLVDKSYTPDKAAGAVTDGLTSSPTDLTAEGTVRYLNQFPYLPQPYAGYDVPDNNTPAPTNVY